MSNRTQRLTQEERQQRLRDAHTQLTQAVDALTSTEGWQAMVNARAWLRRYSLHNLLMILNQRPDASDVRPLKEWNRLGRRVRKGETAIRIWAPHLRRLPADPDAESNNDTQDTERQQLRGFLLVSVFDVSQTEGATLPQPTTLGAEQLRGSAPARLWDQIAAGVAAHGYTIERGDCGDAFGHTDGSHRTVRVRADIDAAQAAKTLIHEYAHIRCGHLESFDVPRPRAEVEAESVACIVAAVAGLNSRAYSVPYVAGWAPDRETVRDSAQRVLAVADGILAELDAPADTMEGASAAVAA